MNAHVVIQAASSGGGGGIQRDIVTKFDVSQTQVSEGAFLNLKYNSLYTIFLQ